MMLPRKILITTWNGIQIKATAIMDAAIIGLIKYLPIYMWHIFLENTATHIKAVISATTVAIAAPIIPKGGIRIKFRMTLIIAAKDTLMRYFLSILQPISVYPYVVDIYTITTVQIKILRAVVASE